MTTVNVFIHDGELIPDDYTVGYAGDHLATQLSITLPPVWQGYSYRLRFHTANQSEKEAFYSKDLPITNDKVLFALPSGVMAAGKLEIQLEARKGETIIHTAAMSMFVGASLGNAEHGLPPNYAGMVYDLFDQIEEKAKETADWLRQQAASGVFDGHGLSVLGLYGTLSELQAAHPAGERGDAYAVGTAQANDVYIWNSSVSAWQNIGHVLGSWTMNDLCIDSGDWSSGTGGWMMDSLCMDSGDWDGPGGAVSTLSEHEVNSGAHRNLILDGNIN